MRYVDGFVLVVPKKNIKAYQKIAQKAGKIWKKCGALEYMECAGDDMTNLMTSVQFPKMAKAKPSETVFFSFIVYKSKAHRNAVNKKVMKDPFMQPSAQGEQSMPFDIKKMAFGGFTALVDL
jgi:uncharacterized protein YbaA (DUF1428 family)